MRIFPSEKPRAGANFSETKLYDAFTAQAATTDWIVLHSIQLGPSSDYLEGETDFYVIVPDRGVIAIEAKAPKSVEYVGGNWHLDGTPNPNKSPLEQVNRARRAMQRFMREQGFPEPIPVARLIWFTSINRWQFDPPHRGDMQFYEWELAWQDDLSALVPLIEATLANYVQLVNSGTEARWDAKQLTATMADQLAESIFGDFNVEVSESDLRVERAAAFAKATEQQLMALSLVSGNKHLYFEGGAGTGKSFLLREVVERARKQNKRVLYTCWNVMMAEELSKGLPSHDMNLKVGDINTLMLQFAELEENPAGADTDWFERELPELAIAKLKNKPHLGRFSTIVIDEFQDLVGKLKIIEFLFRIGSREGLAETQVVLAGDDHQMLLVDSERYQTTYAYAKFLMGDLTHVSLDQNCRMSPRLHRQMTEYLGFDLGVKSDRLPDPNSGELQLVSVATGHEAKALQESLLQLLKIYAPEDIRILSPFSQKRSLAGKVLEVEGRSSAKKWLKNNLKSADSVGKIRWRSIPKFKGLESEVVVITDINKDAVDFASSIGQSISDWLYVGISRARHKCVIIEQEGFDWREYERELEVKAALEALAEAIAPSGEQTS